MRRTPTTYHTSRFDDGDGGGQYLYRMYGGAIALDAFVDSGGGSPRAAYEDNAPEVNFATPRFFRTKFTGMTYQNDIRKILGDNSLKDLK